MFSGCADGFADEPRLLVHRRGGGSAPRSAGRASYEALDERVRPAAGQHHLAALTSRPHTGAPLLRSSLRPTCCRRRSSRDAVSGCLVVRLNVCRVRSRSFIPRDLRRVSRSKSILLASYSLDELPTDILNVRFFPFPFHIVRLFLSPSPPPRTVLETQ